MSKPKLREDVGGNRPLDPTLGYTGYYPKFKDTTHEFDTKPDKNQRYFVPGYMGFVPQVKAENVFGQSYSKISGL